MRYRTLGAVTAVSAVVLCGVSAGAQEAGQRPLSRTLSVQQQTVYKIEPPTVRTEGGLDVVVWADRPDYTYANGEDVQLFVKTSKDAYVTILNVDPVGQTTVLFPNQYQADNRVRANRVLQVPDPASRSRIVVGGTTGTELVKVIASTEPIRPFEAQQLSAAGPFQVVRARAEGVARSLTVTMTEPGGGAGGQGRTQPPDAGITPVRSTEWAMCHQTISTISVASPVQQRTRSLQVKRTSDDGDSARCEESGR